MEAEIKAKVKDTNYIKSILKSIGAVSLGKTVQEDTYFSPPHKNFAGTLKYYLRVRSGKKKSFDYHIVHDDIHTEEKEVSINDPKLLKTILAELDFKTDCVVDKTREEFSFDKFTVTIDEVKGLGSFVEIEGDSNNVTPDELYDFASKLKIDKSMVVSGKGYPDMIMDLKNNGGK